jgi:cytochrome P450
MLARRPQPAPGPSRVELLTRWRRFLAAPLIELERLWRKHGDVVRLPVGRDHFLVVHPRALRHVLCDQRASYDKGASFDELRLLIGDGLLTAGNDAWVAQRRVLAKAFTARSSAVASLGVVERASAALSDEWDAAVGAGAEVSRLVSADFARLTLRISSGALLGSDASAETDALAAAFDQVSAALVERVTSVAKVPFALPTPGNRALRQSIATLDAILARARAAASGETGFLARVAALPDEVRVRDEAMTFLLAGYDTTSNALAFTAHLLAEHPAVQDEVRAGLASGDEGPLERAIAESLRLYPPVPLMLRDVRADDVLEGHPVAAGSVVVCLPYFTHRHPGFWSEPEAFRPERFAAPADDLPAYVPFGVQPRGCIGAEMARRWMRGVLAALLPRFELAPEPGFTVEPEARVTLTPRHGLRLRIRHAR